MKSSNGTGSKLLRRTALATIATAIAAMATGCGDEAAPARKPVTVQDSFNEVLTLVAASPELPGVKSLDLWAESTIYFDLPHEDRMLILGYLYLQAKDAIGGSALPGLHPMSLNATTELQLQSILKKPIDPDLLSDDMFTGSIETIRDKICKQPEMKQAYLSAWAEADTMILKAGSRFDVPPGIICGGLIFVGLILLVCVLSAVFCINNPERCRAETY